MQTGFTADHIVVCMLEVYHY